MLRRAFCVVLLAAAAACAEPRRILSTSPSITEMLFALGLGDRVVGVTTYCSYPPQAKTIRKTGTWLKPDLEAVAAVTPDLVIVQKTAVHARQQYGGLRLVFLEVKTDTIADIYESIRGIGEAAGVAGRASALNAAIRRDLDEVRVRTSRRNPTPVLFLVGHAPGELQGMIAVGRASYLTEVIAIAGGRNIFADSVPPYPKVSMEEILTRDPAVILDMGEMAGEDDVTPERKAQILALWNRHPSLRAVKAARVHAVTPGMFTVPGPRVTELARTLAQLLHPE